MCRIVLFYKLRSPTSWIFISLASHPCPIWAVSWGIHSFLESPSNCLMSLMFSEPQNGLVNLRVHSARPGLIIHSNPLEVSLLSPGYLVHLGDIGWCQYCGVILVPWFPSDKGAPKFLEVLLCSCNRCTGKYYPCLLFVLSLDKEGINGLSYLLPNRISFVSVFPLII